MAEQKNDDAEGGELLFCGSTDWAMMGRSDSKKKNDPEKELRAAKFPPLTGPHRLAALQRVKITFVAAGCSSCHCVALDIDGRCFTWGRNESGQLGHGDLAERQVPTIVAGLAKQVVLRAAAGKHHSVVVTAEGSSFAWGGNQHGQLGTGSTRIDKEKAPVKALVSEATAVACGAEFTMWLTSKEGATIMSAGLPQYGQLGHGTDNEYNAKDSSVKLVYEAQPVPRAISSLAPFKMTRVACGSNHTVATDSNGFVYTWGYGGYGRLGHKEQKDEWRPRQVEELQRANVVQPTGVIAAGAAFSACTAGGGQLYMWGKVKSTGDNWMYPKPHMDLSGWNIRSMDCGNTTSAAAADDSCITWGTALYGELGYGPTGPKSSAAPKKVDSLEGTHVIRVACGMGHSLFVVSRSKHAEIIDKLPVFDPAVQEEEEEEEEESEEESEEEAAGAKRKGRGRGRGAPAGKRGRGGKAAAAKNGGAGSGRGKGKAATAAAAATATAAAAAVGKASRGRGRGRGRGK